MDTVTDMARRMLVVQVMAITHPAINTDIVMGMARGKLMKDFTTANKIMDTIFPPEILFVFN